MVRVKVRQIRSRGLLIMLNNTDEMLGFFKQTKEFIAAAQYTAAKFEFLDVLVEKDFLCSLVLDIYIII